MSETEFPQDFPPPQSEWLFEIEFLAHAVASKQGKVGVVLSLGGGPACFFTIEKLRRLYTDIGLIIANASEHGIS